VSEGVVGEGGAVLCSFIDWFLLLVACLLAWCLSRVSCLVSRVSCESFISSSLWFEQFGAWSISLSLCEREIEEEEMGDDALDRDARIKLSIGTKRRGAADGQFYSPRGLVFDHHRGLLFVVDGYKSRMQAFSCDDGGLFVSKLGPKGQFQYLWGITIDHDHDRILITDSGSDRIQSWSLSDQSLSSCIGQYGSGDLEFNSPRGIAVDKHHHRIVIADTNNDRLVFLSSIDLSLLFEVTYQHGCQPRDLKYPLNIAIDDDRHRIIATEREDHRVQVLSSIDGSFLFQFGSKGNQPGQFNYPQGVCIANQGRIIVADSGNYRLQSFTHEGHHISSFHCDRRPVGVAFDEYRGLIAFSAGHQVHVIGANQWIADTKFVWRPDLHRYAPTWMKQAVSTMTMIRSLVDDSALSMIPNELLFEIFSMLEPGPPRALLPSRGPQASTRRANQCAMM